jgi:hypothetical protein
MPQTQSPPRALHARRRAGGGARARPRRDAQPAGPNHGASAAPRQVRPPAPNPTRRAVARRHQPAGRPAHGHRRPQGTCAIAARRAGHRATGLARGRQPLQACALAARRAGRCGGAGTAHRRAPQDTNHGRRARYLCRARRRRRTVRACRRLAQRLRSPPRPCHVCSDRSPASRAPQAAALCSRHCRSSTARFPPGAPHPCRRPRRRAGRRAVRRDRAAGRESGQVRAKRCVVVQGPPPCEYRPRDWGAAESRCQRTLSPRRWGSAPLAGAGARSLHAADSRPSRAPSPGRR